MKSGEIDVAPEYLGSLLLFLDPKAEATGDPENNASLIEPLVEKDGLRLLQFADANDQNAFVVTRETADEFMAAGHDPETPVAVIEAGWSASTVATTRE